MEHVLTLQNRSFVKSYCNKLQQKIEWYERKAHFSRCADQTLGNPAGRLSGQPNWRMKMHIGKRNVIGSFPTFLDDSQLLIEWQGAGKTLLVRRMKQLCKRRVPDDVLETSPSYGIVMR
jgi:hypothetical protein